MGVWGDEGGVDAEGGGGDGEVGDGGPFAFAAEVVAELADIAPEAGVAWDFGHDVEELLHLAVGFFDFDAAEDFGADDAAVVEASGAEEGGEDLARVLAGAHQVDVGGGVDEVGGVLHRRLLFGPGLPTASAVGVGDGGGVIADGDDVVGRVDGVSGLFGGPGVLHNVVDGGDPEGLVEGPVDGFFHGADSGHFHDPVEFDLVDFDSGFHMAINMGILGGVSKWKGEVGGHQRMK